MLSIIIPAHNEEARLPATLEQVFQFIAAQTYSAEVVIVENGSTDRTRAIAQDYAAQHTGFRVICEAQRGKGQAVKSGMLAARGAYRFMCDADLSMPISEVNRFLPPNLEGFDLAIASREAPGAVRYDEPTYRHLGGRLINSLVRMAILPGLQDTQCGFKSFRASIIEEIFPYQTMPGWSFDIELIYIARIRGYRIVEIPIPWYYNSESKVNALRDAYKMARDILQIRQNARRGLYDKKPTRSG